MSAVVLKRRNNSEPSPSEITHPSQQMVANQSAPLPVLLHLPELALPKMSPPGTPDRRNVPPAGPSATPQSKPATSLVQRTISLSIPGRKRDYRVPIREWRQVVWQSVIGLALAGFFTLAYMLVTGSGGRSSDQSAATDQTGQEDVTPALQHVDVTSSLPLREETAPPRYHDQHYHTHPHTEAPLPPDDEVISTTTSQPAARIATRPNLEPRHTNSLPPQRGNASSSSSSATPRSNISDYRSNYGDPTTLPSYGYPSREAGSTTGTRSEPTSGPRRGYDPDVRLQGIEPPPFQRDRSRL